MILQFSTYFLFILFSYIDSFFKNKSSIFLYASFLAIFRYEIGYDYQNYYYQIQTQNLKFSEPISVLIAKISYQLNFIELFFIVFSFFTLFFIYKSFVNKSHTSISLAVYVLFPLFFLESLSTVRFHLASAIVLYAYTLQNKKLSYLFFFSSIFIHYYSIIAFPFIFLKMQLNQLIIKS